MLLVNLVRQKVTFGAYAVIAAFVVYAVAIAPVHEIGHAAICTARGHEPILTLPYIDWESGRFGIDCQGWDVRSDPLQRAMGGIFGTATAVILFALGRYCICSPVLSLAALSLAVEQIIACMMETILFDIYRIHPLAFLLYLTPMLLCIALFSINYQHTMAKKVLGIKRTI